MFSKEEIEQIEKLAVKNPVILKLWEDHQQYLIDPAKLYYTALTNAIVDISVQIKNKTVDIEDAYTKSILKLAETGDKVFNTLERGKQELIKTVEENKDVEKQKKINKSPDLAI